MFDITTGKVETPAGIGRFVEYDSVRRKVSVELDYEFIVEFDADKCFVRKVNEDGYKNQTTA